jgi:hypothetical protein
MRMQDAEEEEPEDDEEEVEEDNEEPEEEESELERYLREFSKANRAKTAPINSAKHAEQFKLTPGFS